MAKDDSLKKPKKIEVNRIMIFISSILIPFLWIDLYLVSKNTSKLMVVGIIAALILVWTGLLVTYIHRMKNEEKAHSDEQVEELLRTGKANYLMQKKLAEKIDNIGEKDAVPADEIITAQKAIAKLMLARNKENTDALMHSNEQVIEKTLEVEEKLSENSQQIMDMQKNQMDEKLQELMQSQKLVLDNLNDVKESLQSDMQDVLSNMIHDTLEKELASAIEQSDRMIWRQGKCEKDLERIRSSEFRHTRWRKRCALKNAGRLTLAPVLCLEAARKKMWER